ncbi:XisI protein [Leptothoe sp. EHU-05/26/07-4]
MDSLERYKQIVMDLLNDYANIPIANEIDIHNKVLFDNTHNRYILLSLGWSKGQRIHHIVMHIDIIDGQVWIQANNTDRLIAEELVEIGIPAKDIVFGLQSPEVRPHTGYGDSHASQQHTPLSA